MAGNSILNIGRKAEDGGITYGKFDHYSGSQITIWFGDILIDDINSIQWTRQQNKRPIYGYASQQFDAVAKGTVIIQGNFVVNFRQAGYVSLVMQYISRLYGGVDNKEAWPEIRKLVGLHLKSGTFGPKTTEELNYIANSPDFLSLAKAYEDTIWGDGLPAGEENPVPQNERTLASADVNQQQTIPDGFTIIVTYGNNSLNDARKYSEYLQSTTKTLVGVHLVGDSQVIQVGGQPALEQYEFIARGSDEALSYLR